MKNLTPSLLLLLALVSCQKKEHPETLFRIVDRSVHNIDFENTITENDSLNILTLEYIYNGGGVAIADFNNDGLSDVFLTGNIVSNKLYLNNGDLRFQDVSEKAGIGAADKWKSGVAVADVNGDGLMDIYVCATILPDSLLRQNMLFINQGLSPDGIPVFKDEAAAYNVNYAGHSSGAAFFDYDNDNDLDLYILTNTIVKGMPTSYRPKINDGSVNADVLYRNNGDGSFTDVSKDAGIHYEGFGLGLAIADINLDGWQDIYVSNDYITNDLLYLNNQDGTFTNAIDDCIRHQSQFSMGNDVADFNNDGFPDIITLDMLPEKNLRKKTVINGTSYSSYINNEKYGYSPQYIRNVLQLNNGDGTFSEVGQLAGVHQTEWSWSPLFADVDNDGWKDLMVTNGFPRDVTDKDFGNFRAETSTVASVKYQIDSIPIVKVANYVFRNRGDLTFEDVTQAWGMHDPAFSNGASFADLDNDGDLDYIVNNINDEVLLYENTLYDGVSPPKSSRHFLRIKLQGKGENTASLGTKVTLKYGNGRMQYHDHSVYRGYISSVEGIVHFGLDTIQSVDTVLIEWPDRQTTLLTDVHSDQLLTLSQRQARPASLDNAPPSKHKAFQEVSHETGIEFLHQEADKIDFNLQRTIPHKFSQMGPGLAVGDVNGDGREDLYVGGSAQQRGTLFVQKGDGRFHRKELGGASGSGEEDQGALFFDADNDGDQDLYVVSGTFEYEKGSALHQDRLYLNDGKGNFTLNKHALPVIASSGSCVRAADFDGDGDLDLFVGGRVIPGQYPLADESFLLINENGRFANVTASWCPDLQYAGMITDAIWTDVNGDSRIDLVVAGEFMPLTVFQNTGNSFIRANSGLEKFSGWWNSLVAADFDQDGDVDLVGGNLGNNNYYKASPETPLRVYAKDIDGNNSIDAVLSCYLLSEEGDLKEFPVHFWDELNSQSPKFRKRFKYYKQYGRATIDAVLNEEDRNGSMVLVTNHTASSYFENDGSGNFKMTPLPVRTQTAPVHGMVTTDVNGDGFTDVLMVGNDYGNEVFAGRYDAFTGVVLLGDGDGNFSERLPVETGFSVVRDAKSLVRLTGIKQDLFVASQNKDSLRVFRSSKPVMQKHFEPQTLDVKAELFLNNGRTQVVEFYYGSGYLSQSTRRIRIPADVKEMVVYDSRGQSRKIKLSEPQSN